MAERQAGTAEKLAALELRLNLIETAQLRRNGKLIVDAKDLADSLLAIRVDIANLKGRLVGYLFAATMAGGLLLFLAQVILGHLGTP